MYRKDAIMEMQIKKGKQKKKQEKDCKKWKKGDMKKRK